MFRIECGECGGQEIKLAAGYNNGQESALLSCGECGHGTFYPDMGEPEEWGPSTQGSCVHDWADIRNEVISSGEMCLKCNEVRAGNRAD